MSFAELIRSRDQAALRGIVTANSPGVWAYVTLATGPEDAEASVREIFARFFAAMRNAGELDDAAVASTLMRATRRACVRRCESRDVPLECHETARILVAMVERRAEPVDVEAVRNHMRACSACDELRDRFARAERAYAARPTEPASPNTTVEAICERALKILDVGGPQTRAGTRMSARHGEPESSAHAIRHEPVALAGPQPPPEAAGGEADASDAWLPAEMVSTAAAKQAESPTNVEPTDPVQSPEPPPEADPAPAANAAPEAEQEPSPWLPRDSMPPAPVPRADPGEATDEADLEHRQFALTDSPAEAEGEWWHEPVSGPRRRWRRALLVVLAVLLLSVVVLVVLVLVGVLSTDSLHAARSAGGALEHVGRHVEVRVHGVDVV